MTKFPHKNNTYFVRYNISTGVGTRLGVCSRILNWSWSYRSSH